MLVSDGFARLNLLTYTQTEPVPFILFQAFPCISAGSKGK